MTQGLGVDHEGLLSWIYHCSEAVQCLPVVAGNQPPLLAVLGDVTRFALEVDDGGVDVAY
jgi:hypothetical protein